MTNQHLIVFVKNPIPGLVKTRIARTVGNDRAVQVYEHLLRHTQDVVAQLPQHRTVYYGDFVNPDDGWNAYDKHLQTGNDLGQRMLNAFRERFNAGASRAVVIGSDCLAITPEHIQRAFAALDQADIVIGPATDGGYYLLGMKQPHAFLFTDMPWSQPDLRQRTERAIRQHDLTVEQLDELTDIDEWDDYERAIR